MNTCKTLLLAVLGAVAGFIFAFCIIPAMGLVMLAALDVVLLCLGSTLKFLAIVAAVVFIGLALGGAAAVACGGSLTWKKIKELYK